MIAVKILPHGKGLYDTIEKGPTSYSGATPGSCALDLRASEDITILAGQCLPVKTGLSFDMTRTPGLGALVLPRSGLGSKGLILGNSVGLIDNDYQGEVMVFAWNRTPDQNFVLRRGERFAQIAFVRFHQVSFVEVEEFVSETQRGVGGFGSTGAA